MANVRADCLEGIDAVTAKGYVVRYYGEPVDVPYALNAETNERPEGRSFHHGRFVQKLRAAAMKAPNVTVFESRATELVRSGFTSQILGVECETMGQKDCVRSPYIVITLFRVELISIIVLRAPYRNCRRVLFHLQKRTSSTHS